MLRYLKHKDIDKQRWDLCISQCINQIPYAYSWYLNIVAKQKWDAIVIDDYGAVFPVPYKNYFIYKKIYQPFFTQQLGLFVTDMKYNGQLNNCFLLLNQKYKHMYLHLNTYNQLENSKMRVTHYLRLNTSYDTLFNNYSSAVKKNLKAIQNKNLSLSATLTIHAFIEFVKLHVGDKAQELRTRDFTILQNLITIAIQREQGFIRSVYDKDNSILSAMFILKSNNYLIYLIAASSPQGRKYQSMTLLIDSVLKEYSNTEYIFDFEGSSIEGIAHFYKTFGAREVTFPILKT